MTSLSNSAGVLGVAASDSDSYTPPALLLAGGFPRETSKGTLLDQNADLPAFTLIGRITSGGKLTLSDPGASDGSQVPVGITIKKYLDVGADQPARFYRTGGFNYDAINKHGSWTLAALRVALEASGASLFFEVPATATPTEPA
jgi:hypothetical protein